MKIYFFGVINLFLVYDDHNQRFNEKDHLDVLTLLPARTEFEKKI